MEKRRLGIILIVAITGIIAFELLIGILTNWKMSV